jgi:hypothetical protein
MSNITRRAFVASADLPRLHPGSRSPAATSDFPNKTIRFIIHMPRAAARRLCPGGRPAMEQFLPKRVTIVHQHLGRRRRAWHHSALRTQADGYTIRIFNIPGSSSCSSNGEARL